jgi:RNA polymerase sigma-70 factor (ECF subfamily)
MEGMSVERQRAVLNRVRAGDKDAFGELVQAHHVSVRAYLAAKIGDPFEADDLAQEVFLIAFRKLDGFDGKRPITGWLRAIAHNKAREYLRKRREFAAGAAGDLLNLIDESIERREEQEPTSEMVEALRMCAKELARHARDLLRWRYADDLGMAEVCEKLGRGHSTVTMMLWRIRRQLRACVEQRLREGSVHE